MIKHKNRSSSYTPSPYKDKGERKVLMPLILQPLKLSPKKKIVKKKLVIESNDEILSAYHIYNVFEFYSLHKRNQDLLQSNKPDIPSKTSDTPKFNHDNTTDSDIELGKRFIPKTRFNDIRGSPIKRNSPNKMNNSVSSVSSTNHTVQSQRSASMTSRKSAKVIVPTLDIKAPPKLSQQPGNTERPKRSTAPQYPSPRKVITRKSENSGRSTAPIKSNQIQTERSPVDLSVIPESDKITDTSNRSGANDFFITGLIKREDTNTSKIIPTNLSPEKKHKVPENAFTFTNLEKILSDDLPSQSQAQTYRERANQTKPTPPHKDNIPNQKGLPKVFQRKPSSRDVSPNKSRNLTASQLKLTDLSSEETSADLKKGILNKAEYLEELRFQFEKFKQEMAKNPRSKINTKPHYLDQSKTSSALSLERKTIDTSRSINRESYDVGDLSSRIKKSHYRSKSISTNIKRQNQLNQQKNNNEFDTSSDSKIIPTTRFIIAQEPAGTKPKVPNFHFRRFSMGEMKTSR